MTDEAVVGIADMGRVPGPSRSERRSSSVPTACTHSLRERCGRRSTESFVRSLPAVTTRTSAGSHRTTLNCKSARVLCVWRRTYPRRSSSGDGELARTRLSRQSAPTSRGTSGRRSGSRPTFVPAFERAGAKRSGTARQVFQGISGSRMAGDGRSSATPATIGILITAQGISDAFVDAEMLAEALTAALSGNAAFEQRMAALEFARNERVRPMYRIHRAARRARASAARYAGPLRCVTW